MKKSYNDSIFGQLIRLALPVIGGSFMSMAYSFVNMLFVGKLGADSVAAVGSAGFFINLGWALSSLITVGVGIKVSHANGAGNKVLAKSFVLNGKIALIVLAILYLSVLMFGGKYLISILNLKNQQVEALSIGFLIRSGWSIPFTFLNNFYSSVFIGYGNSRIPFRISSLGLLLNILLDPIAIFGFGLGINGAAYATILSQMITVFLYSRKLRLLQGDVDQRISYQKAQLRELLLLGMSPTLQRMVFVFIAIGMARIISNWGTEAIAVQKVGVQIEALSYMTISGFTSALSSIAGKAYGAKDYVRQWKSFLAGLTIAMVVGLTTTVVFMAFPEPLFSLFLRDSESLRLGKDYLVILAYSQLFMCIELLSTGAFYGWGKTYLPAIISITLTSARIPLAYILTTCCSPTLNTIWWCISLSSMAKGLLLTGLFFLLFQLFMKTQTVTDGKKECQCTGG
ncbi:MAG TPA: MATE family efflux transporter [Prolixibacteraceae bacterium]|nr:MATE family efflux transporter [Prolixibacteraceae bacterium]